MSSFCARLRLVCLLSQLWAGMAMFRGHQCRRAVCDSEEGSDDSDAMNPKRRKYNTAKGSFVDSGEMSWLEQPTTRILPGTSSSSVGYVDLESYISGLILEDDTLRPVTCVIRHIFTASGPCIIGRCRASRCQNENRGFYRRRKADSSY
ncbi:hypothetical protein BJX99DRAFT_232617 [Aspergillus californicus]